MGIFHNNLTQSKRTLMLKKTLLSALLTISTLATAQINLELNMTITHQELQRTIVSTVIVDEDTTASVMFEDVDTLSVNFFVHKENDTVLINTQFFQAIESNDSIPVTELFTMQVPLNEAATLTVNDPDNNGSLTLVIIPTLVE